MFVKEVETGRKHKVNIVKAGSSELSELKNFDFDWNAESQYDIYKLSIVKSGEIIGLMSLERVYEELRIEIRLLEISRNNVGKDKKFGRIAGILIAFACKESFQNGFYGFVSLIPKTTLIGHYISKYGFKQYGKHLVIELKDSENLMNKYLTHEKH